MDDDSIYSLTPAVETQHLGNNGDDIELKIKVNECEGWYASCLVSVHKISQSKIRKKSLSDEENGNVPPPKVKYVRNYTFPAGNVSPIAIGNLGIFADNTRIVSQSDIRSDATIIGKPIIKSVMGKKNIFANSIASKNGYLNQLYKRMFQLKWEMSMI